ncbi:hypothetical protein AGMMS49546_08910 [Spirochaetia bacterium]|nr:hypothetical protein AGMMS49546_08910 [Spirochaetia bacterium]
METMTLSGALGIRQGRIAIEKEGQTWYVRGLDRFIGFIDGLKEGAVVTLEGRGVKSAREENTGFLQVTKLTLNGKTYDLSLTGQKK